MIAHPVAVMLASADVYDGSGNPAPVPSVVSLPNSIYASGYEFYHELVSTLLIYGNFVAVIYEGELVPVHPTQVQCRIGSDGFPAYRIGENFYHHDDILHVRGFTLPGQWWGIGVIEAQRRGLGAAVNMQSYAANTYSTGAVPTGTISLDTRTPGDGVLAQVAENWQDAFGSGNRKPVVLPLGMTFDPIQWSPEDSQFLQSRQFNVAEIALMFGLSPTDLTATIGGTSLTYANISEANLDRIQRSYARWVIRIESAFRKLLPEGYKVIGNPEALLRMDTKSRYESYAIALANGWLTVEEVRALEHLEPLPPTRTEDTPTDDDNI
jgi:HK97 family phage portal protein